MNSEQQRGQILQEVFNERTRQKQKGTSRFDPMHTPLDWYSILIDYVGWYRRMACMGNREKARRRLIQVAALAVAAVEAMDNSTTGAPL